MVVEGDLLEGGGGLGEEDDVEGIIGPVGEIDFYGCHAEFGDGVEGGSVDIGGGGFLHPLGEVADSEAIDRGCGVEVEMAGDGGEVMVVRSGDGVEDEHGVFYGAGHGAQLVE